MNKPPTVLKHISRSRGGCQTCKKRRKKCDETKPICLRCCEGNHVCLGYQPIKPRRVTKKSGATRAASNAITAPATITHPILPFSNGLLDFLDPSLLSFPAEILPMSTNTLPYDPVQSQSWETQTQLPHSVPDAGLDMPVSQSSTTSSSSPSSTSPSPITQSQVDSFAFISALSGPSMFGPPDRSRFSSPPSGSSSVSRSSSPFLVREGKIFTNDLGNNLLDIYSTFFTKMGFDWRSMRIDVGSLIQSKANKSPVLRNTMLAMAAFYISFQERSEAWKWKQKALEFISSARERLGNEVYRNKFSAERKFEIFIELLNFEVHTRTVRAESTRALLEQCKDLIIESLGSSHINIGSFRGFNSINYAIFAWFDIKTSMHLSKPTLLTYHFTNLSSDCFGTGAEACRIGLEAFTFCPDEITVCLFHISALREYALADLQRDGKLSEMTRTSAQMTEDAIRAWQARPASFPTQGPPERLTIMECWRLTALIYLYQVVYRVGPLHCVLSDCVEQFIALAKTLPTNVVYELCLTTPDFIVGTAAVKKKDRAFLRARLAAHQALETYEYVEVLDELWAKVDLVGAPTSWGEIYSSLPLPRLLLE